MNYKLYKESDYNVSNWTGGKTKQLAIYPENGDYLERRFVWRLSSATCELEESSFSKLPDFDRVLIVLDGEVVLAHDGVRVARLKALEQDRFDGGYNTKSFGKITDYNLMVSKGNQGFADILNLENTSRPLEIEDYPEYNHIAQGFYCRDGFITVTFGGNTVIVNPGEQLVVEYNSNENLEFSVMGEGNTVRCQIFYNLDGSEMGPTIIEAEKTSFDDFKACAFLANTQFRGASLLFKSVKTRWLDEELSEAVRKLEKACIPFFLWLAGIAIVAALTPEETTAYTMLVAMAIWTIIDILLVTPLMYLAIVPKPVRAHIKDIRNLTKYEQQVYEEEMNSNERLERLMRKYQHTGRARYDENGNRLDKTFKDRRWRR